MIRHIVMLKFKATTPPQTKMALYADLRALNDHIDGSVDFQARTNISTEDSLVRGFRDVFWFDFRDACARDAYLSDTKHKAVGQRLIAELEGGTDGICVCDVEM